MKADRRVKVYLWIARLGTWNVALVILIIGAALVWWAGGRSFKAAVGSVGGTLVASVALLAIWQLIGRESLLRHFLEEQGFAKTLADAKISQVTDNCHTDVDWASLLGSAREFDILFVASRTWRQVNQTRLIELSKRSGVAVRCVLPDPEHEHTVAALADAFGTTPQTVAGDIAESATDLRRMLGAALTVYVVKQIPWFSMYRCDDTIILSLYAHHKTNLPALVARRGGYLYGFAAEDFNSLLEKATVYSPSGTAAVHQPTR